MRWLGTLAVMAILASACNSPSQAHTASTTRTSSPSSCLETQAAPRFAPSSPSSRNLEIVWFKGSQKLIVRDLTDILNPTTISTFDKVWNAQFVSATELAFQDGDRLLRAPLSGTPRVVVAACPMLRYAWNPDGTGAAYITGNALHLISGGRDRIIDIKPGIPSLDCLYCEDLFDMRLEYSPDGEYISLVQNWGWSVLRIWTSDGDVVKSLDRDGLGVRSEGPTMSAWSGKSFYFRDEKGVEMWRDGVQSLLLPGVAWIRPKPSPLGGQIVYGLRDSSGKPNVYLLNTSSGEVKQVAKSRSQPAFLNSHLIWYREERPCATGDEYPCPKGPTIWSGKTFIYDLDDKTETESVIAAVFDVWPHPA